VGEAPRQAREPERGPWWRSVPRGLLHSGEALAAKVPGLRRVLVELVRVEVFDRSVVIAAQALLGLVPLLIVLVAFLPPELAAAIVNRFEGATGLSSDLVVSASQTSEEVRVATGWAGLAVALLSVTSFAGAVQRMLEHVWREPHRGGLFMRLRGLLWFTGWILTLQLTAIVERVLDLLLFPPLLQWVTQATTATLVWWWTAHVLLVGRVTWSLLAPAALFTGCLTAIYSVTSDLWMSQYVTASVRQFGSLGLVLTVATWLIGFALVITVSAVLGHVVVTTEDGPPRRKLPHRRRRIPARRSVRGRLK
jgi:membrane protein